MGWAGCRAAPWGGSPTRPENDGGGEMAFARGSVIGLALVVVFAAQATAAVTSILVFDDIETTPGTPIGNTEVIPQSYGDLPGLIDVRYGAVTALGSAVRRQDDGLLYWHGGYSDLAGVAFCCGLGL